MSTTNPLEAIYSLLTSCHHTKHSTIKQLLMGNFYIYAPNVLQDVLDFLKKGIANFGGTVLPSYDTSCFLIISDDMCCDANCAHKYIEYNKNSKCIGNQPDTKQTLCNSIYNSIDACDIDNIRVIYVSTIFKEIEFNCIHLLDWHHERNLPIYVKDKSTFAISKVEKKLKKYTEYYTPSSDEYQAYIANIHQIRPTNCCLEIKTHIITQRSPNRKYCGVCLEDYKEGYIKHLSSSKHNYSYRTNIDLYKSIDCLLKSNNPSVQYIDKILPRFHGKSDVNEYFTPQKDIEKSKQVSKIKKVEIADNHSDSISYVTPINTISSNSSCPSVTLEYLSKRAQMFINVQKKDSKCEGNDVEKQKKDDPKEHQIKHTNKIEKYLEKEVKHRLTKKRKEALLKGNTTMDQFLIYHNK